MKKFKLSYRHILLVPVMVVSVLVCVLLAWYVIPMTYNPMRRSAPMIRNHILRHTSIGMCMEEVIEVIENNESWGTPVINRDSGFRHPALFVEGPDGRPTSATIGEKQIQSAPEWYNTLLIFERHIRIFWGFDENGKLIEVHVSSIFAPRLV